MSDYLAPDSYWSTPPPLPRIVRGLIRWNGDILAGAGFAAVRELVGQYKITFLPAFAAYPNVQLTTMYDVAANAEAMLLTLKPDYVQVYVFAPGTGAAVDQTFSFFAIDE